MGEGAGGPGSETLSSRELAGDKGEGAPVGRRGNGEKKPRWHRKEMNESKRSACHHVYLPLYLLRKRRTRKLDVYNVSFKLEISRMYEDYGHESQFLSKNLAPPT